MTLYTLKNKIFSLCKIKTRGKGFTPEDIEMYHRGFKYGFRDLTKWNRIAYFKTEEAGKKFAKEQGYTEW